MQMKKVIAGCIDLMLEFDSASELDRYIADIEAKAEMMIQLAMSAGAADRSSVIDRLFCSEPFCNFTQLKDKLKENS